MLDIGWTELLVIAVILIVVVGPKDLPPMIRAFGKMTKRLRQTAGEFRAQFDEALREAELDDLKKSVDDVRSLNPANSIREALNPLRQMGQEIKSDLERSTRFEPKSDAEDDGMENSILPELPFGLDEPPQELRTVAQQGQPVPASQPASAAAVGPTTTSTEPVAPVSATGSALPATTPATSAPATAAPITPVAEQSAPSRKPAPKASTKAAAPAKAGSKSAKAAPVLPAAVETPKAAVTKTKTAATKPATAKTAPTAETKAKAAAKPRKTKSEDRA